jgi:hypothetical protein
MLAAIIGHGDAGGAEGVGLDHVRARLQIGVVDRADDIGPGDREQVVIALLVLRQIETAAIIGFLELVALDRGAIAAVEDEDAFCGSGW